MGGGEDASPHNTEGQNSPTPPSSPAPAKSKDILPLETSGEIMIGISLFIILVVIVCCIAHLIRKQRRERYPHGKPKSKEKTNAAKDLEKGTFELHSADKQIFEVGGSEMVLCELPADAHPRQEMYAGFDDLVSPFTPIERTMTGTTVTDATDEIQLVSPAVVSSIQPWPERTLAVYWQTH